MNITWKNCLKIGICIFVLFLAIYYWASFVSFLGTLINAIMPIIIGFAIAYVLNILTSFYERHYFTKFKDKKFVKKTKKGVCLITAILTLIGVIALVIWLVIPELVSCVKFLVSEIPPLIEDLLSNHYIKGFLPEDTLKQLTTIDWFSNISNIIQKVTSGLSDAFSIVATAVSSVVSTIITIFFSIIFSIYILSGKSTLQRQCKKVLKRYLPEKITSKILYFFSVVNNSFHKFIVGQCTEAVILGVLCIVGMLIFRFPYAPMIGTLIGFCALIPVAGAFIGAGIGAIMIATVSPLQALLFIVFIIVLQQLEGNFIYPRVVGSSLGLPPLWVLAAVTIGGSLVGVLGMLIGVPITSVIYKLLKEDINKAPKNIKTKDIES